MDTTQITIQKTDGGFSATFPPLEIVAHGRTEAEAHDRVAADVSKFLSTTSPMEVLDRCLRHFEAKARMLDWITSPEALAALGRPFALRIEILAQHRGGHRTLTSIAKEYGVSPQAISKMSRRLRNVIATKG